MKMTNGSQLSLPLHFSTPTQIVVASFLVSAAVLVKAYNTAYNLCARRGLYRKGLTVRLTRECFNVIRFFTERA